MSSGQGRDAVGVSIGSAVGGHGGHPGWQGPASVVPVLLGHVCAHRLRAVVAEMGVAPALTLGETDSKQDPAQVFNHGRVANVTAAEGGSQAGSPQFCAWKDPSRV